MPLRKYLLSGPSKDSKGLRPSYRPEIDGLRAVAVLAVIGYHADLSLGLPFNVLGGGFLGVDVFFVISGVLITRILLREYQIGGDISIKRFYIRRGRRILPALFLVLIASLALSRIVLYPSDQSSFANSALSAVAFVSNFFFAVEGTDYAGAPLGTLPLLHTWSLGIEEQFYLFWPFILIFVLRGGHSKSRTHPWLLGLLVASFLSAMVGSLFWSEINFFLPTGRLWELGVGALLALGLGKAILPVKARVKDALVWSSLSLLLLGFNLPLSPTSHPWPGLIAVIATVLLLESLRQSTVPWAVLTSRPVRHIGKLSYALYLWHFPIFAFFYYANPYPSPLDKLFLLALTLVLSEITYRLVETPWRDAQRIGKKAFISGISVSLVFFAVIFFDNQTANHNATAGNAPTVVADFRQLLDYSFYREEHRGFEVGGNYDLPGESAQPGLFVVGNSHGEDFYKVLSFSSAAEEYELMLSSSVDRAEDVNYQVHCLLALLREGITVCEDVEFTDHVLQQYERADFVFLATRWREADINALPDLIEIIVNDGKAVIVVSPAPESKMFKVALGRELNRFDAFLANKERLPSQEELAVLEEGFFQDVIDKTGPVFETSSRLANTVERANVNRVIYLNQLDFRCTQEEERCTLFFPDVGSKVLWDDSHLTTEGAKQLGMFFSDSAWREALR